MSSSSGQKDPSMDEILGSIRRIITEDAQSGQPADAAPDAGEDDILDLTDEVGAAGGAESRVEPVLAPIEPVAEGGAADDTLERREPVFDVQSAADFPAPDPLAAAGDTPAEEPADAGEEPAASMFGATPQQEEPAMAESDFPATPPPAGQPPAAQPPAPAGDMVSGAATTSAAAALGELSQAIDERVGRLRLGEGDSTVSDMVKELIRPMLAEWIDQNLPGIVERVVQREIQKLVDRTQDGD